MTFHLDSSALFEKASFSLSPLFPKTNCPRVKILIAIAMNVFFFFFGLGLKVQGLKTEYRGFEFLDCKSISKEF